MINVEILVIGGGPAGLSAALAAANMGAKVTVVERDKHPGGQLVKQTHKFFGSVAQSAGERGYLIGRDLIRAVIEHPNITLFTEATAVAIYEDGVIGVMQNEKFLKFKAQKLIVTTGAAEKFLVFPGNDLPGIYGAGAVQTLMNVHGVVPAKRVLMVGSGNIGLIVSYQLTQAGVQVAAVIEALPKIGGYLVHASKIRRAGIPIKCGYTILEAFGDTKVEGARIAAIDEHFQPIPGTEEIIECDAICLAVGLTPLTELCWQARCEMKFIRQLSGHVPVTNDDLMTSVEGLYVAGDVDGIEEATAAMVEGRLAGCAAAQSLGYDPEHAEALKQAARDELSELRAGPTGGKIREGIEAVKAEGGKIHVNLDRYPN